ncbi:MAG TPA: cytochrome c oxidase subunit 4 [Candidatus Limnocylindrales bacterium]
MPRIPEEIAFWIRSAVFGVGIGGAYWFVTYEWAGSILLGLFGVGSAGAAAVLGYLVRRRGREVRASPPGGGAAIHAEGPLGDDQGRLPDGSTAPFVFAVGLLLVVLGLAYGGWFVLAALVPLVLGGVSWLSAANAELEATERSEEPGDR